MFRIVESAFERELGRLRDPERRSVGYPPRSPSPKNCTQLRAGRERTRRSTNGMKRLRCSFVPQINRRHRTRGRLSPMTRRAATRAVYQRLHVRLGLVAKQRYLKREHRRPRPAADIKIAHAVAHDVALVSVRIGYAHRHSVRRRTLTAFLVGITIGQLIFGPLSDRFGRLRPLPGSRRPRPRASARASCRNWCWARNRHWSRCTGGRWRCR